MLVAAKIVEYPIVHGNYTLLFTEHLVNEAIQPPSRRLFVLFQILPFLKSGLKTSKQRTMVLRYSKRTLGIYPASTEDRLGWDKGPPTLFSDACKTSR